MLLTFVENYMIFSLFIKGTRGSEIYEISASDGSDQHGGPLIQGHCEFELWGLDVHPSKSQVCTYTSFPVFLFSFLLCFFIPFFYSH